MATPDDIRVGRPSRVRVQCEWETQERDRNKGKFLENLQLLKSLQMDRIDPYTTVSRSFDSSRSSTEAV